MSLNGEEPNKKAQTANKFDIYANKTVVSTKISITAQELV